MYMNVAGCEHCAFDNYSMFLVAAMFITLTTLTLLGSCKLLFPFVGLEI